MKKTSTFLLALFLSIGAWAQSPDLMSYQAVIRNAGNMLVVNQSVGMQLSILQGSPSGSAVYIETQNGTQNVSVNLIKSILL